MSFQDENDDEDLNGGEIIGPKMNSSAIAVLFMVLFGVALPLCIVLWKAALS